jgi:hypothetical protein
MSFTKAFGLSDNPFRPMRMLQGVENRNAMRDLHRKALRIHEEPALECLFVQEAGPFAEHLDDFCTKLSSAGYSPDPRAAPLTSFAFLVSGEQGTGKSTLVNAMLGWLLKCHVEPDWVKFIHPPEGIIQGGGVPELASYLPAEIAKGSVAQDYCCVVVDDLTKADADRALRLWDEVTSTRTLILFLITAEERLLYETQNSRVELTPYRTQPLTPDQAVELVRRRIAQFRDDESAARLQNLPLFPFDEDDIRNAVKSKADRREVVTLRTFHVSLHGVLEARLRELSNAIQKGVGGHEPVPGLSGLAAGRRRGRAADDTGDWRDPASARAALGVGVADG